MMTVIPNIIESIEGYILLGSESRAKWLIYLQRFFFTQLDIFSFIFDYIRFNNIVE